MKRSMSSLFDINLNPFVYSSPSPSYIVEPSGLKRLKLMSSNDTTSVYDRIVGGGGGSGSTDQHRDDNWSRIDQEIEASLNFIGSQRKTTVWLSSSQNRPPTNGGSDDNPVPTTTTSSSSNHWAPYRQRSSQSKIPEERRVYQQLLAKAASKPPPTSRPFNGLLNGLGSEQKSANVSQYVVNLSSIDDHHGDTSRSNSSSIDLECSPPLESIGGKKNAKENSAQKKKKNSDNHNQSSSSHSFSDDLDEREDQYVNDFETPSTTSGNRQASQWLDSCQSTPYLSSQWLSNLTDSFQRRVDQKSMERQLVEAKVRHWETQRCLTANERLANIERRLSCLRISSVVLPDPYLVPQPVPQEPLFFFKPSAPKVRLPVLTSEQSAEIDALLGGPGGSQCVLVNAFRLSVTRCELLTLASTNWLSDMVVNFYLQLLAARSRQQLSSNPSPQPTSSQQLPRVAVMTTFFYTKLSSPSAGGYAGVRRWSRNLNLLDQDLVFIPIHDRGMHWCLVCADLRSKTISYYDSMGSCNDACLNTLMSYFKDESLDKKNKPLDDADQWRLINTEESVPQQYNGSDCGVFMCTFAEFLSRNAEFTFGQDDMPGIRKRMMYEIVNQCLLTTDFKVDAKP